MDVVWLQVTSDYVEGQLPLFLDISVLSTDYTTSTWEKFASLVTITLRVLFQGSGSLIFKK